MISCTCTTASHVLEHVIDGEVCFFMWNSVVFTHTLTSISTVGLRVHAVQLTIWFHGRFESIHFDAESKFSVHSVVLINFVEIRRLVKILGSIHLCLVTCNTFSVADSAETKSLLGSYFCGVHITGALSCFFTVSHVLLHLVLSIVVAVDTVLSALEFIGERLLNWIE